jgi:hypothetical protein
MMGAISVPGNRDRCPQILTYTIDSPSDNQKNLRERWRHTKTWGQLGWFIKIAKFDIDRHVRMVEIDRSGQVPERRDRPAILTRETV